jgi:hypothetical protein
MNESAQNDPNSVIGDLGNGPAEGGAVESEDADLVADLMRSDDDPLPDAQVPGAGPDGQAPNTPA